MDIFRDYLPIAIQAAQEMLTRTCSWCDGTGRTPAWYKVPPPPATNDRTSPVVTNAVTKGNSACPECSGVGTVTPDALHPHVAASVLIDLVSSAVIVRDQGNFASMNDMLDAGMNYIKSIIAKDLDYLQGDPEAADLLQKVRDRALARSLGVEPGSAAPSPDTPSIDNALTPEEITALGLDDAS